MLNFHAILYDFFIKGLELDTIAAKHETSWREVTEIVSSEPAMQTMRAAIRAERLRDIAENLASRRAAIRALEGLVRDRSLTAVSHEGRRRAAAAILSGTTPRGRTSRATPPAARPTARPTEHPHPATPTPTTQVPTPASESPKQSERTHREQPRKPVSLPAKSPRQSTQVARTPVRKPHPSPSAQPKPSAPSNRRGDNSS